MERMELNHWFVGEDNLSISLTNHFVNIKICRNGKEIFYRLELSNNRNKLVFNFCSLEDAVKFTEDTIFNINEESRNTSHRVRDLQSLFLSRNHNWKG